MPAGSTPLTIGSRPGPRTWERAAALGSVWASIEIVVGSFLHNLSVPFAGSVLAALAVIVITAAQRTSRDRGVIWRAAVVCALMKSVSPSAVILGPMVGILTEGLLVEASVRLLGPNALAYLVGGALAVSWSSAQKILSALITFGPDLVRLYVEACDSASRSLGVSAFRPFDLVATFFGLQALLGVAAALVGLRLGRGYPHLPATPPVAARAATEAARRMTEAAGRWSLGRLVGFTGGLVAGMTFLQSVPFAVAITYVAAYSALVWRTYTHALSRLRRPMFWIQLGVVLLLAGALLGGLRPGAAGWIAGVLAGAQMVLRATLVVFGFAAVSVELRNPRILGWLERRRLRGLSDALGLAFGGLPAFVAALADQRSFWRQPLSTLGRMLQMADTLYVPRAIGSEKVVILTGLTGSGKTTKAEEVVAALRRRGLRVGGILARGLLTDARRSGFDLEDLAAGRTIRWCREEETAATGERWGRFVFSQEGLQFGRSALAASTAADIMVIDEVGPLELAGGGWSDSLDRLLAEFDGPILLVARVAVVDAVCARWGYAGTRVYDVASDGHAAIAEALVALSGIGAETPALL